MSEDLTEIRERLDFLDSRLSNLERSHQRLCEYIGREDALAAGMFDDETTVTPPPECWVGTIAGAGKSYTVRVVPVPEWDND